MVLAKRSLSAERERTLSTSRPSLLVDGSDGSFRVFVQSLFSVAGRLELIRERVSGQYGISGVQFGILMGIRQLEGRRGVSLTILAEHLQQRGTFVTSQTNRLRERGFIRKDPNPNDGRGVLLRLAAPGRDLLAEMLPLIAALNDKIFGELTAAEFSVMRSVVAMLVESTDDALTTVERMAKRVQTIGA